MFFKRKYFFFFLSFFLSFFVFGVKFKNFASAVLSSRRVSFIVFSLTRL